MSLERSLMKTGLNNVLLPALFNVATILFSVVTPDSECHINIVWSCCITHIVMITWICITHIVMITWICITHIVMITWICIAHIQ